MRHAHYLGKQKLFMIVELSSPNELAKPAMPMTHPPLCCFDTHLLKTATFTFVCGLAIDAVRH